MEPSRWELKIPLRVLCILSDDSERMGLPDLRAREKIRCIQISAAPFQESISFSPDQLPLLTARHHLRDNRPPVNQNHAEN